MSRPPSRTPGRRLRLRLAAAGAAAGVGIAILGGAAAIDRARDWSRAEIARAEARTAARAAAALGRHGLALEQAVGRLVSALRSPPGGAVRTADLARRAPSLAALAGLDVLSVADGAGRILASLHWPERVGLDAPELLALPPGRASVERIDDAHGRRLAWVVRAAVGDGGEILVGGRWLGPALARELGGETEPVALVGVGDEAGAPALSAVAERLGPAWLATAPGQSFDAGQAGRWGLRRVALTSADGSEVGALLLGIDRSPPDRLLRRLLEAFAVVGLGAGAAGALAGRRLADRLGRPVDRLVQAVDAVRAGEADYTFAAAPEDELQALAAAFSRLRRAHDEQLERARAAERAAAWREAARQVAHEVKNPLVPIRLTVENLQRARQRDPALFDELFESGTRTILEEVEHLRRLVSEFSEYARLPAPQPRGVDLHELIDGVLELYAGEPGLEVVRSYAATAATVRVDPEQMARVLKNLVGNAVEAMRGSTEGRRTLEVATRAGGEGGVDVEIADRGPGLADAARRRLFEPDFTTKAGGTGLGLAIAARIVSEHGGRIEAANRPGGGASFVVRLPGGAEARA